MPLNRVTFFLNGQPGVSRNTAVRLPRHFRITRFRQNLQVLIPGSRSLMRSVLQVPAGGGELPISRVRKQITAAERLSDQGVLERFPELSAVSHRDSCELGDEVLGMRLSAGTGQARRESIDAAQGNGDVS